MHLNHLNYGVISGSHACRDCVWPMILDADFYTTCPGERGLVVIRFNVIFLPLSTCYEKMCRPTCFLKDAESLTAYGCVFWCSQIVYIRTYSLNTKIAFYFVTEGSDVPVMIWGGGQATTHSYILHLGLARVGLHFFSCPTLDVVLYQVLRVSEKVCVILWSCHQYRYKTFCVY